MEWAYWDNWEVLQRLLLTHWDEKTFTETYWGQLRLKEVQEFIRAHWDTKCFTEGLGASLGLTRAQTVNWNSKGFTKAHLGSKYYIRAQMDLEGWTGLKELIGTHWDTKGILDTH